MAVNVLSDSDLDRRRGRRSRRLEQYGLPLAFMAPGTLLILALVLLPSLYTVVLSFQNATLGGGSASWVGLANYVAWLRTGAFVQALWLTLGYCAIAVVLELLGGFTVALVLNERFWGRAVIQAVMLIPWVLPAISTANIWVWMLNPSYGIIDTSLMHLGLMKEPVLWLSSSTLALPLVAMIRAWRDFSFVALMLLAGIQAIPQELYEAAKVDGAGPLHRFWHVTLPGLRLVVVLAVMLQSIFAFNDFSIYLLTQGGPAQASQVLALAIYQQAFGASQFSYGAAGAVLTLLVLSVLVAVYLWLYVRNEREVT
ncbi:MAG: sugar ABC transporter permease [Candidatus Dormiibacterota bacterium]